MINFFRSPHLIIHSPSFPVTIIHSTAFFVFVPKFVSVKVIGLCTTVETTRTPLIVLVWTGYLDTRIVFRHAVVSKLPH